MKELETHMGITLATYNIYKVRDGGSPLSRECIDPLDL